MINRLTAEALGTAGLVVVIVGSGIRSEGTSSVQLFHHAVVVGGALAVLIATLGPVSAAHFNPAVTTLEALFGGVPVKVALAYIGAQVGGAMAGVVGGNLLFGLPAVSVATTTRSGLRLAVSEVVATLGLLVVIFGLKRSGKPELIAVAAGGWVAAAMYFTPSTSFANPAVTIARAFTDTYTGISASSLSGFLLAQLVAVPLGAILISWLFPGTTTAATAPRKEMQ